MSKALIPLGLIGVAGVMGSLASGQGNRGRRAADLHNLTKRELRARLNKLAEKRHDLGKRLPIEKMSGHVMPLWINDDDGFRFKSTDLSKRDYTRMSANYYKLWQEEGAVEFILRDGEMEEDPEEYHQAMMRSARGRRAEKKPAIWGYINWTEGRQRPIRYSMPVYSAKQADRTKDEFANWHPSKKRVSISSKKPRNARPVPQHDQD
jgi:hypothetical protein